MANLNKPAVLTSAAKAVFWDRDGVLVEVLAERDDGQKNVGPRKFEDLKIAKHAAPVLKAAKLKGYLNIVVTNQPDVSRGNMSAGELAHMHKYLKETLPEIDAIYVCPHQDSDNCACRKPKPGMLLDAAKKHNLDLKKCFMVGDSQKDIDAAKSVGVRVVLLKTAYNQSEHGADYHVVSLAEIVDIMA